MTKRKRSLSPVCPHLDEEHDNEHVADRLQAEEAGAPEIVMPTNARGPQEEGTPTEPILSAHDLAKERERQRPTTRTGKDRGPRNSSPHPDSPAWKNSRYFSASEQNKTSDRHDRSSRVPSYQDQRQDFLPRDEDSATDKLKATRRSTSYTTPLPLFAEDAEKSQAAPAPLTVENLKSHQQTLTSKPAPKFTPVLKTKREDRVGISVSASPSATAGGTAGGIGIRIGTKSHRGAPPKSTLTPASSMPKTKSPSKASSPKKSDKKKSSTKYDEHTHPLNLPPDQLRAHLAHMARQEAESAERMSIDREVPADEKDSSIPNGSSQPATPSKEAPGAFPNTSTDDVTTNGASGHDEERSPTPPPHKVPPAPKVDPEACKAAGNKFFKAKDYDRAVQEYTKGRDKHCMLEYSG
jgi:DnaJ homolog subfamily C member 7